MAVQAVSRDRYHDIYLFSIQFIYESVLLITLVLTSPRPLRTLYINTDLKFLS